MPIAIFEIPTGSQIKTNDARTVCENTGNILHETLKVPEPEDKETRVIESSSNTSPTLRLSFTIGPKEYPDYDPPSFFPTQEEIDTAGQAILEEIKNSSINVSHIDIEAWSNTTFMLREDDVEIPTLPISEQELLQIGKKITDAKIVLILSPQKREGSSISKEIDISPDNESREAALRIAERFSEILGTSLTAEAKYAQEADTDISVEFDCGVEQNSQIPENVREYLAETALHTLDSIQLTREGSAEVWIRQGLPTTTSLENK